VNVVPRRNRGAEPGASKGAEHRVGDRSSKDNITRIETPLARQSCVRRRQISGGHHSKQLAQHDQRGAQIAKTLREPFHLALGTTRSVGCRFVKTDYIFTNSRRQHLRRLYDSGFCGGSRKGVVNCFLGFAVATLMLFAAGRLEAQITILHSFSDGTVPNDGRYPQGLIQAPDGNFYGVTFDSGVIGKSGTIFRMTPASVLTVLYAPIHQFFSYPPLFYKGRLIDTLIAAGKKRNGALLSLAGYPNGPWTGNLWHIFGSAPSDGAGPSGSLILGTDGKLYGTTAGGGTASLGTVYSVDPATHQVSVVASFTGPKPLEHPIQSLLQATDGNFYGGTEGSTGSGPGAIFKVTSTGKITMFHKFSNYTLPSGPLIQASDGNFYGTTFAGLGEDTVFRLTKAGVFTVLYTFSATVFTGGVIEGPNHDLYGMTAFGGTANQGIIFKLAKDGSSFTVLHNFGDGSVPNDGDDPIGTLIVGTDSNLYGVTQLGGSAGFGTVFRTSP
jgi:uncharacterized repeat protein (TIGR03803 family)